MKFLELIFLNWRIYNFKPVFIVYEVYLSYMSSEYVLNVKCLRAIKVKYNTIIIMKSHLLSQWLMGHYIELFIQWSGGGEY